MPLVDRQDDGTGKHRVCPQVRSREEYLREQEAKMPHLVRHQEALARGEDPFADEGRQGRWKDETEELSGDGGGD